MFDIGWTEMLVVAVVAIIFVAPKDLPGMLRTFGQVIKRVRGMAGDFQKQMDTALKDAELDGIKDTLNDVRSMDPTKSIKDKLNPLKSDLEAVDDDINTSIEPRKPNPPSGANGVPGFSSQPATPAPAEPAGQEQLAVDVEQTAKADSGAKT